MKGFKATDENGKCLDHLYEVNKTYELKSDIEMCKSGFHFCINLFDVYRYYAKSEKTRIFEIEALGEIKTEDYKSVTNKIKILRELTTKEILKVWINITNSGRRNSGSWNSGDWNSGDWNSGNGNSGSRNSGSWNNGDGNSGNGNSGNGNSGSWNSGSWNNGDGNSGNGNSGNGNSGSWNNGDGNSGYFNTGVPLYFFNKPTDLKWTQELENKIRSLNVTPILTYVTSDNMTEEEKLNHPSHKTTGGFLRKTDRMDWKHLTETDKEFIKSLPNFDDDVFEKISGISLQAPKSIKVIHDGKEFEIDVEKAKELGIVK